MKSGASQIVPVAIGLAAFFAIIALRMHQGGPTDTAQGERVAEHRSQIHPDAYGAVAAQTPVIGTSTQPPSAAAARPEASSSEPAGPEVPVSVVISPAPNGGGHHAVVENRSADTLLVTLTVSNPKVGHKYTTEFSVAGYGVAEFDGIATERGDEIRVASSGYKDTVTFFE